MEKIHLQMTSGRGPRECAYVVARLLAVISREAKAAGLLISIIVRETSGGPLTEALLSATILLEGIGVQSFVGTWLGTIQWIGNSPYRPKHRRKNWFVGVTCADGPTSVEQLDGRIAVQTMRASGPGGQNVNKTNSAVRVTHVQTGISVTARESRSQSQNRKRAHQKLHRLFQGASEARMKADDEQKWADHQLVERGNPTRLFHGDAFVEKLSKS